MSATIANQTDTSKQLHPWYRYGWPWFLISIPLVSVGLGMVMLNLAFNANNSLVVDDYYKEGKAYNLRIERDRLATLLGLQAVVTQTSEGLILELNQQRRADLPQSLLPDAIAAEAAFVSPDALLVRWVHVTQSNRDGVAPMTYIGGNRYIAQGVVLPSEGKFRLHIEPGLTAKDHSSATVLPNADWRLISSLTGLDAAEVIDISASEPEKVFTGNMLQ